MNDFTDVTELPGSKISKEQLYRMYNRYHWTAKMCANAAVLEVACGAGQGLGLIAREARSVVAGDVSDKIINIAREHYRDRVTFIEFDAQKLPFSNNSFDVIVMHEALYYIREASLFIKEAYRALSNSGILLITVSNKDTPDFNPSPHATVYHGVPELHTLLNTHGFESQFWGSQPLSKASLRQKLMRPAKIAAVGLGVIPKTMKGKQTLKRIVFGQLIDMPTELTPNMTEIETLTPLFPNIPCKTHRIIYCKATKNTQPQRGPYETPIL